MHIINFDVQSFATSQYYHLQSTMLKYFQKKWHWIALTCGVSFCIDVVILNFVLLLLKFIFNENEDSASISSYDKK